MQLSKQQANDKKVAPRQAYIDWFIWPVVLGVSSYIYDMARQYYNAPQSDGPVDWYHVAFIGTCLILTVSALEITKRKHGAEAKSQ